MVLNEYQKNIFERLTNLVQDQFNFGSVFAGGVVGAFATVAFLNTAPLLTVGMDQNHRSSYQVCYSCSRRRQRSSTTNSRRYRLADYGKSGLQVCYF